VNLLAVYSDVSNRLSALQLQCDQDLLGVLDDVKEDYTELQGQLTQADSMVEAIASRHPEWFKVKKSIATPYGTVKFHSSKKLDVPNEEASIVRIQLEAEKRFPTPAQKAQREEFIAKYVRTSSVLDKEALEKEEDSFLTLLGIKRTKKENFSIVAATLDMGKAVKEAVETEEQKQAA
jgi:hypothetical protein